MRFTLITERRRHAPRGREGGGDGAPGRNLLNGEPLPSKAEGELAPGDRLRIETPGGGGYGRAGSARLASIGRVMRAAARDRRGDARLRGRGGDGPAVLFVHGLGGSAYALAAAARRPRGRAGTAAIAYDQRGAGRSAKPAGPYSVEQWAEDLSACSTRSGSSGRRWSATRSAAWSPSTRRCGSASALGRWRSAAGALEWRPRPRARCSRSARGSPATGRMDEIAEAVAAAGLSERCRAERPELHGLMLEPIAVERSRRPTPNRRSRRRAPGAMRDPERIACPVLAFCRRAGPGHAARPSPRRSRRRCPTGEPRRDRGRRPLVHARGAGGGQRRSCSRSSGRRPALATLKLTSLAISEQPALESAGLGPGLDAPAGGRVGTPERRSQLRHPET